MSDERDETRHFSPFDDATEPGDPPTGSGAAADQTRPMPPADQTRAMPPADQTRVTPRAGQAFAESGDGRTRAMPADPVDPTSVTPRRGGLPPSGNPRADATSAQPADDWAASRVNSAWAGRAEVRAPQPGGTEYQEDDWSARPVREPRDRWWMPIVIGIVTLVLLGALGWGIYLIVQNSGTDQTPTPATTSAAAPQPAVTAATTPPTTEPTTAATTPPATTPSTPEVTGAIQIPALKGRSLAEAQAALNANGLSYRLIYRTVADAAPGTVIDSDPLEGQEVPPDTRVTLVIAAQPTGPTTPSSPSTTAPAQPGTGG